MEGIFNVAHSFFLTFKGKDKKHQSINYMDKMMREVSNNYYIVRERNKKTEGYHFHAIFIMVKKPKKSWFKKGCHTHLQEVGYGRKVHVGILPEYPAPADKGSNAEFIQFYASPEEINTHNEEIMDNQINKLIKNTKSDIIRLAHVKRTLTYMRKEQEFPIQYHDYIYVLHGKSKAITTEAGLAETVCEPPLQEVVGEQESQSKYPAGRPKVGQKKP